jgi:hypothetical protein
MAVSPARKRQQDALKVSCDRHKRYRSKADAAMLGWHPICADCRRGKVMQVFPCEAGPFWHVGHIWIGESGASRCFA